MIKVMSNTPETPNPGPLSRVSSTETQPNSPFLQLPPTQTQVGQTNIPGSYGDPESVSGLTETSSIGSNITSPINAFTPAYQQSIKDIEGSIILKNTVYKVENFGEYNNKTIEYIYTEEDIDYDDRNRIYIQFSILEKLENNSYLYKLVKDDYYIIVEQDPNYKTRFKNFVTKEPINFTIIGDDVTWNSTHKRIKSVKISTEYKNKVEKTKQETKRTNPTITINETLPSQDMVQGMSDSEKIINRMAEVKKLIKIIKIKLYTNDLSTPQERQEILDQLRNLLIERDNLYKEIEKNMLKKQLKEINETFNKFDQIKTNEKIKEILYFILNVHQIIFDEEENEDLDKSIENINKLLKQNKIKEAKTLLEPILRDQLKTINDKLGLPTLGGKRRHRKTKKQNRKSRKTTKKSRKSTKRNGNFNIMPTY
jgi:7,8-dihydro-6-hydroxymethylpterin-pyrophosphokinase